MAERKYKHLKQNPGHSKSIIGKYALVKSRENWGMIIWCHESSVKNPHKGHKHNRKRPRIAVCCPKTPLRLKSHASCRKRWFPRHRPVQQVRCWGSMGVANGAKAFTYAYSLLVYLPQEKATIPETNTAPQKMTSQKETSLEKTSIFRGYVSFREAITNGFWLIERRISSTRFVNHSLITRKWDKGHHCKIERHAIQ